MVVRNLLPGKTVHKLEQLPSPGDRVVIHAQGRFREAEVVKVGPRRTTVAYATSSTPYRTKALPHHCVFVEHGQGPEYTIRRHEDARGSHYLNDDEGRWVPA